MKKIRLIPFLIIILTALVFLNNFFIQGKLPIPSDTIVGLYHPFRDLYAKNYPNGIPFKNFLITDPVRQQYPWRELAISLEKKIELPLWNPYSFAGTPLLANLQSAPFYIFNIIFFLLPFELGWSVLIFLQPLLAGIFLYFYLNNLRLNKSACLLGSISFIFSGFFISWFEWGTILHVGLWLPLILLSIDKIFLYFRSENNSKLQFKDQKLLAWGFIFVFSLISSFFAGHLQTFFYLFIISIVYLLVRWLQFGKKINIFTLFVFCFLFSVFITIIQWFPTLQFIILSARDIDQSLWNQHGWFIPWQNLIQFVAPDFFGNPATLNYWGVWNYAEFIGYIGILPLIIAVFAMFFRRDKKTLFFGTMFFLSLIFSLPTFFAKLPFILNIPFLSSAQPTRLLFVTDFSLAVLAAFGLDYLNKDRKKILYPIGFLILVFVGLWLFIFLGDKMNLAQKESLLIAKRNLFLPTIIFIASASLLLISIILSKIKSKSITIIIYIIIVFITVFDLFRFGWKFTPFTTKDYLYPKTATISFLQKNIGNYRLMSVDPRIFPPNFSIIYRLQSIEGYDPLYLKSYGEFIAALERGKPDINPPFGFNRIITPQNFESKMIDFLGVKYILSLSDLNSPKLEKVFQEGQTRVYINKKVLPRAFFVEQVLMAKNKKESINMMFDKNINLEKQVIVEDGALHLEGVKQNIGKLEFVEYLENKILIETENRRDGFLVLTDTFYPIWHVNIDGKETKIYRADYNFRGVSVPKGKHKIEFYNSLF